MNLRAIAVLKNSRDCVLSPSSMIFFFSLKETFDSVRVRISTAGLCPLVDLAQHALARASRSCRASRRRARLLRLRLALRPSSWRPWLGPHSTSVSCSRACLAALARLRRPSSGFALAAASRRPEAGAALGLAAAGRSGVALAAPLPSFGVRGSSPRRTSRSSGAPCRRASRPCPSRARGCRRSPPRPRGCTSRRGSGASARARRALAPAGARRACARTPGARASSRRAARRSARRPPWPRS